MCTTLVKNIQGCSSVDIPSSIQVMPVDHTSTCRGGREEGRDVDNQLTTMQNTAVDNNRVLYTELSGSSTPLELT